jgi:tetratricopeptide (TPR) repeat protein
MALKRAQFLIGFIDDYEFYASILNSLGGAYEDLNQMDSAMIYLTQSEEILDSLVSINVPDAKRGSAFNYQSLGLYYEKMDMLNKATEYFSKALTIGQELDNYQLIINNTGYLAGVLEKGGNYKDALKYYQMSTELNDSIMSEENTVQLNKIQAKFEEEKARIIEENKAKERARQEAEELKRRNNLQHSLIFIGVLILFAFTIFSGIVQIPQYLIEGLIFFTFLILFEFILVFLNPFVESYTYGQPIYKLVANSLIAILILPIHRQLELVLKVRLARDNSTNS